jgi:hypothetical protein
MSAGIVTMQTFDRFFSIPFHARIVRNNALMNFGYLVIPQMNVYPNTNGFSPKINYVFTLIWVCDMAEVCCFIFYLF